MKILREISEVKDEGLLGLIGENVTLYCSAYIYTGKLVGINDTCVKLSSAKIVYDTGPFSSKDWSTAESFPGDWYIQLTAVESFGRLK